MHQVWVNGTTVTRLHQLRSVISYVQLGHGHRGVTCCDGVRTDPSSTVLPVSTAANERYPL
jgi:hypothetical protein